MSVERTDLSPQQFDLDQPWALAPAVSIRPERFGALAYDFVTRRLSFLKSQQLATLVTQLADHPDARTACGAVGVEQRELDTYTRALARLAATGMIVRRA